MLKNHRWLLAARPDGIPGPEHDEVAEKSYLGSHVDVLFAVVRAERIDRERQAAALAAAGSAREADVVAGGLGMVAIGVGGSTRG